MENIFSKDQLVIANDPFDGEYIGQYVSQNMLTGKSSYVKILACTRYPLQRAIFYAHVIYERKPYEYGSVHSFSNSEIKVYDGPVPEYNESVRVALDKAIEEAGVNGNMKILAALRNHKLQIA